MVETIRHPRSMFESKGVLKTQAKTVKILKQTGKVGDILRDKGRKAKLPGKRISKTGKVYWETRVNRSDSANKSI